jgi:hypothetical protein
MLPIAIMLALVVPEPQSRAHQDSARDQMDYKEDKFGGTCRFRQHPRLALLNLDGMKIALWHELKPETAMGPPATLSISFNRPRPGANPWLVTFGVDFLPGSAIDDETVEDWTISIDGDVKRVSNRRPLPFAPPIAAPAPPEEPAERSPAPAEPPPPPRGPMFVASPDDEWFARLSSAKQAIVEFHDSTGRVLGRYQWKLGDIGKDRAALDRIDWTCTKPSA